MKSDFGICTVPGRVASATTIAVGEERTRGSAMTGKCRVAAQHALDDAFVAPLRGAILISFG